MIIEGEQKVQTQQVEQQQPAQSKTDVVSPQEEVVFGVIHRPLVEAYRFIGEKLAEIKRLGAEITPDDERRIMSEATASVFRGQIALNTAGYRMNGNNGHSLNGSAYLTPSSSDKNAGLTNGTHSQNGN